MTEEEMQEAYMDAEYDFGWQDWCNGVLNYPADVDSRFLYEAGYWDAAKSHGEVH